uniref:Protein-S-isoprenylcysteine O-methyltransferase n=1 Tax=Musa acuminata subsp. malaccensis TaxID=214687 RepID=A0A804HMF2_MUSAM|nr:PREDICTED: protein-S-isoprenylcysteine O-methyltransferase A isoform X1 [Musa acuminata subsp. malaccensis]XP_009408820.1 PREDICTED: protein-S-isoprenylcysteine O-methyltransferase A isoform X1 [Musa acuminata subsp. malaccensis]
MRSPISPGRAAESNPNPGILLLRLGGGIPALLRLLQGEMAEAAMAYTASRQLPQFIFAVAFFHSSEYALAVFYHGRSNVTFSSLLISKQYVVAMVCALLEYAIEILLFPRLKEYWWVSNIGLVMILIGELIRKAAVITAGQSFTHLIRKYHDDHHELITHGIYRFVRHPGYTGFFIWATGTQIMLCNPVCIIAFIVVVWRFFSTRIPYEEFFLRQFFGFQYVEYAKRVPSGLPFIR